MDDNFISVKGKVVPNRIKEARIARQMTLSDLALNLDITKQAISQMELGRIEPLPQNIRKMSELLDFPISFFYKNIAVDSDNSEAIHFRKNSKVPQKLAKAAEIRLHWLYETYSFLNKYVDFPKSDIPGFLPEIENTSVYDEETIENIAYKLREYWVLGEGPIDNLVNILQKKGVLIGNVKLNNPNVDAYSKWMNGIPVIILGKDKGSAVRYRFSLAHELGHLILHSHITEEDKIDVETYNRIEDEANMFASSFLMPEKSFVKGFYSSRLESFINLKYKWKVSIGAMIMRAKQLNLINENQSTYLWKKMSYSGYRKNEPLDDEIKVETPVLMKQAIEILINNKIFTAVDMLNEISLNKDEIDILLTLPKELLENKTNIINLKLKFQNV